MAFTGYEPFEPIKRCNDPSHDPPGMIVLPSGVHTYECPTCGEVSRIVVPEEPTL